MTQIGLYRNRKQAVIEDDKCTLNLKGTKYGGVLTFYEKDGKIVIGQSNEAKKGAIWKVLEPVTDEFSGKPSKRRRTTTTKSSKSSASNAYVPSPEDLWSGRY